MPKGIPGSRGICTINDCNKPHKARGRCAKHYGRWQYRNLTKPRDNGGLAAADERTLFDLSDTEAAWLAGLFEGEGNIQYRGNSVRLTIQMTDQDVITKVCDLTHGRKPRAYNRADYDKTTWYWSVGWRPDVEELLLSMLPWFGARRRAKALGALERLGNQVQPMRARYGA